MRIMNKAGKLLIIFGIMAFLGSFGSGQPVEGFILGLLIVAGTGGLLLYASGARKRKYRRLGEQTSTYYEQIRAQPQREPPLQTQQQTAGRVEPPVAARSQSLEAGLFDE